MSPDWSSKSQERRQPPVLQSFETELLTQEDNLSGLAAINRELIARAVAIEARGRARAVPTRRHEGCERRHPEAPSSFSDDVDPWYVAKSAERHERNPSVSYNCMMARGWESKSVEAQIEESFSEPSRGEASSSSAEELQSEMKRADLMLSRKHVLQQLERSASERYSQLLRRTLADLDAQIAAMP